MTHEEFAEQYHGTTDCERVLIERFTLGELDPLSDLAESLSYAHDLTQPERYKLANLCVIMGRVLRDTQVRLSDAADRLWIPIEIVEVDV